MDKNTQKGAPSKDAPQKPAQPSSGVNAEEAKEALRRSLGDQPPSVKKPQT